MILDQHGKETKERVRGRANGMKRAGQEILDGFRSELASIKSEQANRVKLMSEGEGRENSFGGLLSGLFQQNALNNGSGPSATSQPFTLSNANFYVPITLNRILLSYSYMTQGLLRTVVDQPIEDAFRGGVKFTSDELDEEDLTKLNRAFKRMQKKRPKKGAEIVRTNINAGYELSNSDLKANMMCAKWARLYGGSGLIVNTDQDFRTELDVERIKDESPLAFIAADRWELILSQMNLFDERIKTPYNYYGLPLHASRVTKMMGAEAPSYIRLRLQGWGMSILEESIRAVNAYIKFENLLFELLDEAKINVYKIKGFNTSLASDVATEKIHRRVTLGNQLKNFSNALAMDSEDDYAQKQLTFSGLAEIKEGLRLDLCAYLKIPMNKLFGQSAGGFSSGKDSLDNYNSTLETIREGVEPALIESGGLRAQQLFGFVPEDLEVEFSPLDVLDGTEQEAIKTSKQARALALNQSGLTDGKETSEILKKEELLIIDTAVLEGTREQEPPLSQNPDEVAAGQDHELKMAKAKPKPAAAGK